MTRRVFIDAMNVIRSNISLAKSEQSQGSVAEGRKLLHLVREYSRRTGEQAEWVVVFDGPSDDSAEKDDNKSVQAIFSEERSADEIILEMAVDAVAVGHEVVIVSNDAEVRVEGAPAMRVEDFYADLIHQPPPRETEVATETYEDLMRSRFAEELAAKAEVGRRLIAGLVELGHLPTSAAHDARLGNDLLQEIDVCSTRHLPLQKAGKRLESFFRRRIIVIPDPDPQRVFFRALKDALSKEVGAD